MSARDLKPGNGNGMVHDVPASGLDGPAGASATAGEFAGDVAAESAGEAARPPLLTSDALLRGHRAVEISHNGVLYRLQATRLGKLILTK